MIYITIIIRTKQLVMQYVSIAEHYTPRTSQSLISTHLFFRFQLSIYPDDDLSYKIDLIAGYNTSLAK